MENFYLSFIIMLYLSHSIYITKARKLDICGYSSTLSPSKRIDFTSDRWFQIGQLYSYCMQLGNLTTFDKDCKTAECKDCMKACSSDEFEATACITNCSSNQHCINGCKFYNQTLGGPEFLNLDTSNTPQIIQDSPAISEYDYNVNYKWDGIYSKGTVNLSSVYLVTTVLRSDQFQSDYKEERFLMLTTSTSYNLTISDVCQRLGAIPVRIPKKKYRINIYPINRNGWNRVNVLKASYIRKNLTNVPSVEILRPRSSGSASLEWDFIVPAVTDNSAEYIKVYTSFQGSRCRGGIQNFLPDKTGESRVVAGKETNVVVNYYDPGKDLLDGCQSIVEVYAFYDCLDAGPVLGNFAYVNCSYVRDYKRACPYVAPTQPPPDEIVKATYVLSKTTCFKREWTSDLQVNCSSGDYSLSLTWSKPWTYRPITEYLIRWGALKKWIFDNTQTVWKGTELGKTTSQMNTSFLIEHVGLENTKLGIEIHPKTARKLTFRYPRTEAEYTVYNAGTIPSATFPLEIDIEKTGESCTSWSYAPCFAGDAEFRCEECTEGYGMDYTVTWESKNKQTALPDGAKFLVQWGPGVLWTDKGLMMLTSDAINETSVEANKTQYRIQNVKKVFPKFGVRVEVDTANNTKHSYTLNYEFFKTALKVELKEVSVANFTCTNRTITFDSEGHGQERCEHGDYDLLFHWKKPETNRSVSYMVRWGPRNPRQASVSEALVLTEQQLGDVATDDLYQEIKGIKFEKEIGIELHVKTRLAPSYPYSPQETGYTWFTGSEESLPKPIKQNLDIETKLIKSCQEYKKVQCFSGDVHLSCVECQNGSVIYQVTWRKWEKRRKRRSPMPNDVMYLIRWGAAVEYGERDIVPLDSELGWIRTESNNVTFNITKIHPLMGFQVFAYGEEQKFSVFSENYVFNQIPPLVPPPVSKPPPPGNNDTSAIVLGVLIPLILIVILIIVFIARKKRGKEPNKNPFDKDGFGLYNIFDAEKGILADDWEIDPKTITLDEKIGAGAFGTVYSATVEAIVIAKSKYGKQTGGTNGFDTENNPKVAVKLLKDGAQQDEFADFKEEITLMKSIGYHKNIVNMIGCSTLRQPMCLLVEFMEHGDLLNYLRKRRSKLCTGLTTTEGSKSFMYTQQFHETLQDINSVGEVESVESNAPIYDDSPNADEVLTPDDLLSFSWQIAAGMEFLTVNNMVHRDLAARNILIGSNKVCKVSDFGLTRKVGDSQIYTSQKSRKLPIKWMSVEAIFEQEFTMYSDVWAYGVLLFEIVTLGGTPYPSVNNRELLAMLKSGYRMDKPENCADPMYDIMLHCWNEDPLERPTFTELRDHLEQIMSQSADYLTFDIDQGNTYYNVASFNSIPSDDEEEQLMFEADDNAPKVKSIEELKEAKQQKNKKEEEENAQLVKKLSTKEPAPSLIQPDEERYVKPQPLKSFNSTPNGYVNAGMAKDLSDLTL